MIYKINIRETLERLVDIEADSAEAALLTAKELYDNGDIVLDAGDFKGAEFCSMEMPEEARQDIPKNSFEIYQLRESEDSRIRELFFQPYERLAAKGKTIRKSDYRMVYSAELLPGTGLDDIYTRFNIDRPEDFKGHSLSISDIIVVRRDGTNTAHYVDPVGYKEVPEFLQPEGKNNNRTKGELTR